MTTKLRIFILIFSALSIPAKADLKIVRLALKDPLQLLTFDSQVGLSLNSCDMVHFVQPLIFTNNLGEVIGHIYLNELLKTLEIKNQQLEDKLEILLQGNPLDLYKSFIIKLKKNNYYLHRIGIFINIDDNIMSLVEFPEAIESHHDQTLSSIHQEYKELIILLLALLKLNTHDFENRYSIKVAIQFLKEIIDQFSDA